MNYGKKVDKNSKLQFILKLIFDRYQLNDVIDAFIRCEAV